MSIEIKIELPLNLCPYCLGTGKQKAMQMAVAYDAKTVRTADKKERCSECNGTGYKNNG
ncbi:hypothetical protein D3C73_185190 [compost metagenome]